MHKFNFLFKESFKFVLLIFAFSSFYIFLFKTPLFKNSVLFYRGVFLIIVSALFFIGMFLLARKTTHQTILRPSFFASCLIAAISLNLVFFTLIPVTLDRSLSTFILKALQEENSSSCGHGYTDRELEKKLIADYFIAGRALEKRLHEQTIIGNIITRNQCVSISKRGEVTLKILQAIYNLYK